MLIFRYLNNFTTIRVLTSMFNTLFHLWLFHYMFVFRYTKQFDNNHSFYFNFFNTFVLLLISSTVMLHLTVSLQSRFCYKFLNFFVRLPISFHYIFPFCIAKDFSTIRFFTSLYFACLLVHFHYFSVFRYPKQFHYN